MQNPAVPVLLIVEELNRANAPAVFGDTFQLLDGKTGLGYSVAHSEDLKNTCNHSFPRIIMPQMVKQIGNGFPPIQKLTAFHSRQICTFGLR